MLSERRRKNWRKRTQKFLVEELTRLMDENGERHQEFLNSRGYADASIAVRRIKRHICWDRFIYVLAYYDKVLDIRIADAPHDEPE